MNDEYGHSIILIDEDDNEIEFEIMDKFDYKGECYYVLLPIDDDSDEIEYVILRESEVSPDDEPALVGIEDVGLLDEVFETYKKRSIDEP